MIDVAKLLGVTTAATRFSDNPQLSAAANRLTSPANTIRDIHAGQQGVGGTHG